MNVADRLGLGPKREAEPAGDGWLVKVTPAFGGEPAIVYLTGDQHRRYQQWLASGTLIQHALPDLSDDDREILISGLGPDDFDELAADDE